MLSSFLITSNQSRQWWQLELAIYTHSAVGASKYLSKGRGLFKTHLQCQELEQVARARVNYGFADNCGDPGCQFVILWLHTLPLGMYAAVKAGDRGKGEHMLVHSFGD